MRVGSQLAGGEAGSWWRSGRLFRRLDRTGQWKVPRVRGTLALTSTAGNESSGADWCELVSCPMRCLSPTPQDSGTLTTLHWVSPSRRTWRSWRRLAGDASTSLPLKVGNAGNGYSTLSLPFIAATGNGVLMSGWNTVGKAKASCLGTGSPTGSRENRSVAETSKTHPGYRAVAPRVPSVLWLAVWRGRVP